MGLFVGVDWGSRVHSVCVLDAGGQRILQREVLHEGEAILAFGQELAKLAGGDCACVRVAMESPHGAMLEALIDMGATAFHLNPKQLDRFRDRHTVAGAKDDALDAFVLADSLRTDERLFRPVPPMSEFLLQLRAETRTAKQLLDHVLATANQVTQELQRYYPQLQHLGAWHDEPWLWELFRAAADPAAARKLSNARVQRILKKYRIRRYTANRVLEQLRTTAVPVAAGVTEACSRSVEALLPLLEAAYEQRKKCLKRTDDMLKQSNVQDDAHRGQTAQCESHKAMLRDAELLRTLPGLGNRTCATVLARAHVALHDRDYSALRRLAGVAPVSRRTGGRNNKPLVCMRRARDPELATAIHMWAWATCRLDADHKARYAALRARGHTHARALRGIADRLLRLAMGVLKSGLPYDRRAGFKRRNKEAA